MKIICDVCGTTFPETATHCPICGCAKSPAAKTIPGDDVQETQGSSTANTYAKGGRFSKSNVQRNSRSRGSEGRFSSDRNRKNDTPEANKGLIAVVVVLLLAIISVVVYIGVTVLGNLGGTTDNGGNSQPSSSYQEGNGDQTVACTGITLGVKLHEFTGETDQLLLSVKLEPENTTETATFLSSDPEVATVDANGLVKPGTKQGEATITVVCGSVSEECKIISKVGEAPVEPEPEIPDVVLPDGFVLKLKTYKDSGEITLSNQWPTAILYTETMGIKPSDITWTISDPSIVKVENGKAIGLSRGTCTIVAAIGDQTYSCKVLCSVDPVPETPYELSDKDGDMTIVVGKTATLSLKDKATGANVQNIVWQVSKEGYVEIDGNKITAVKAGTVDVYVVYEDVTYKCIVRVANPAE